MSHFLLPTRPMGMNTSIVIVGGGYAGLLAANRAASHGHRVTLVNDRETFVDRIRLHEYIAGTRTESRTARPLRDLVHNSVNLHIGRAVGFSTGQVWLATGDSLVADHVVLATGSSGASGGWSWANRARADLAALGPTATVSVVGAGLTGIEVATEIAAARPGLQVALTDAITPGSDLSDAGQQQLLAALAHLRVEVRTTTPRAADLTIDCTGFRSDDLTGGSQLDVDEFLRIPGLDRVWAAGDGARVIGQPHLRMGCATAEPMARHVIDQIGRHDRHQQLRAVSIGYAARCLSLGRRLGLIQFTTRDDAPTARVWRGRIAAAAKETICRYALIAPVRWARWYRELHGPTHA